MGFLLISFVSAIFCSLGFCPGMMKMANAAESMSMTQQPYSNPSGQKVPCSSSDQSNSSQDYGCCKCLDTAALLKADHKNQTFDFTKAFPLFTILVNQISLTSHLEVFDHSPPKTALNSTPVYILNKVLRL